MVSGKTIAALMVALTIAATLFVPISDAVSSGSGELDVENESVTADVGNAVELEGYSILEDSESVERYNSTSDSYESVASGTDYEMDYTEGTITALEGGAIDDGDELRVSYSYEATDEMTTTVMVLIPMMLALLILVSIARPVMDAL